MNYSSFLNYSLVQAIQQHWITPKHEMFSYDLCSLNYSVVQAVPLHGANLNSWNIVLLSPFLNYSVVQAVQQGWTIHRTYEMFSYDPCFLNYTVVQAVWLASSNSHTWDIMTGQFLSGHVAVKQRKCKTFWPWRSSSVTIMKTFAVDTSYLQLKQVNTVALPRTHGKLFYNPRFFNYSVVLADQLGWIPLNSINILPLSFEQFGCVQLT